MVIRREILRGWQGAVRIAKTEKELLTAPDLIVQSSPITVDTAVDTKYVIGQRSPYAIVEGSQTVTGTFTRPLIDDFFARLAGIQKEGPVLIPEIYHIGIFPGGIKEGEIAYVIKNARFGSLSADLAPDDIVDEDLDWSAEGIEQKLVENVGKGGE